MTAFPEGQEDLKLSETIVDGSPLMTSSPRPETEATEMALVTSTRSEKTRAWEIGQLEAEISVTKLHRSGTEMRSRARLLLLLPGRVRVDFFEREDDFLDDDFFFLSGNFHDPSLGLRSGSDDEDPPSSSVEGVEAVEGAGGVDGVGGVDAAGSMSSKSKE